MSWKLTILWYAGAVALLFAGPMVLTAIGAEDEGTRSILALIYGAVVANAAMFFKPAVCYPSWW